MKGALRKSDTFWAYLHIAASMTGNLGKFSTEPAADGGRIRTKKRAVRGENGREEREGRRVQTTWKGWSWLEYSVAANGFPDSNQTRRVGQELWGGGRRMRKVWAKWQKSPSWRSEIYLFICSRQKISKTLLILFLFSCFPSCYEIKKKMVMKQNKKKAREGKKKNQSYDLHTLASPANAACICIHTAASMCSSQYILC